MTSKENKIVTSFAIDPKLKVELIEHAKLMGYKSMSQYLCDLIAKDLDEAEYGRYRNAQDAL